MSTVVSKSKQRQLPAGDGAFISCTECLTFCENNENEISRHIRIHHPTSRLRNQDGAIVYNHLLRVPRDIAVLLCGQEKVASKEARISFTGQNSNPKSREATPAEIVRICTIRGVVAPARYAGVVAAVVWPPV